jgi:phage FluMu protein Com
MSLVGTLLFCTACGDLLDRAAPAVRKIACRRCCAWNTSNVPSPHSPRHEVNMLTTSRER